MVGSVRERKSCKGIVDDIMMMQMLTESTFGIVEVKEVDVFKWTELTASATTQMMPSKIDKETNERCILPMRGAKTSYLSWDGNIKLVFVPQSTGFQKVMKERNPYVHNVD